MGWQRALVAQVSFVVLFFFQAEDGIRDLTVTGVQTCALPILQAPSPRQPPSRLPLRAYRDLLALNDPRVELPALDPPHAAAHRRLVARFVRYHLAEAGSLSALDFWERRAWVPPPATRIPIPSAAL